MKAVKQKGNYRTLYKKFMKEGNKMICTTIHPEKNIRLAIKVAVIWLLSIMRENNSTSFMTWYAWYYDANDISKTVSGIEAGHYFVRDRERLLTLLRARKFSCTERLSNEASMFPWTWE
jgi:hypothetical protein